MVKAASWLDWGDEDEEDLRVIDLGEAFHKGAEPAKLAQPGALRAPETIFTSRFDYRVDLWRAGIMVSRFLLLEENINTYIRRSSRSYVERFHSCTLETWNSLSQK